MGRSARRTGAAQKAGGRRLSNAERSAFFARREAAKVLKRVLQGDARRRAVGSIKSLVYSPSVRNKKATFALVCQTLKHFFIIKDVLEYANVLNGKWKREKELMYIITYDILFGQEISLIGDPEEFLMLRKDALQIALARLLVSKSVKRVEDLMASCRFPDGSRPRYVRVNTLKLDVESALRELGKEHKVQKDDMVPDLLILPPGIDLHDHPLVINGSIFMQGKASSMVAVALGPKPGWEVLDACAAPGNKTAHLAALMEGKGKIIACELNKERVKRLDDTVQLSGADNVVILHGDFLNLNPEDPLYSKVRAILLDPSCSGSGTAAERLDHLLPSYAAGQSAGIAGTDRLKKLAAFQKKTLAHALSFPAVERVVYSTCSIHQTENEDVIKSVLPIAASHGFQLGMPFPGWPRRGLPVLEGSEYLLRTDPVEDKEGFFIALFVRKTDFPMKNAGNALEVVSVKKSTDRRKAVSKQNFVVPRLSTKVSKLLLYPQLNWQKLTICRRNSTP
ncbi:25S rRNA (cytosine-C(5))-methyltransferase NSUN5 isoform X2 [Malania oleifera]|uniref:25S rRNA (cytosine-C(5))-methyltransferase NSUN5 isoform X2 n=1 Tax=Malania oleifera TaxID=397392 RepID=UPI0025AE758C|nr:25S rRNA (cytosine-C(5))-methyltransferase NSUN5 isoform X2 [Malania oleifera]